ncbi:MAG: chemotaxis protein CheW [Pirellula sp.]|jgi:two-component system chemotaxis sensor kinase CheA|nr:chemotaxis protein CheW [Pirellula sp.]
MFQDDELVNEFVVESAAHLAEVEGQLLAIEAAGENCDPELVNTVFRAVHSVKGAAGFLSLTVINSLSHSLENVLNLIRNRELVPNSHIVNALLRAADQLFSLVNNVETSNEVDVSHLVAELEAIASGQEDVTQIVSDHHENFEAIQEQISSAIGDQSFGDMAAYSPAGVEQLLDDQSSSDSESPINSSVFEAPTIDPIAPVIQPTPSVKRDAKKEQNPMDKSKVKSNSDGSVSKPKPADSIVRVNVAILDRLMNLAGELVLSRNQLISAVSQGLKEGFEAIAARVDQVTSELQETIMQTRMQPIGSVFGRFPRVVRDLSAKLGKECSLEIEGDEVEVDKTIVEAMGDPLTHLVRNSVDHGIETPDRRRAAGKVETGTVRLRAFHQAGKVCIRIEDDGAGMDPVKLKTKAIEKGIISVEQAALMTENEAYRLIFAPGFSTAAQVTDVSGRGVGMDVVKTNIEQLGGTVDIESEVGKGSAVHITLPLTLAIVPSMIIGCAGERYAVPQANIVELVRVPEGEMQQRIGVVQGAEVLRLRGALLPLVRLDRTLKLRAANSKDRPSSANILVLETGQIRYGLLVDSLFDNEEIVVKPLGKHVRDLGYLAGATILGDGYVALILDVMGIAMQCNLRSIEAQSNKAEEVIEHGDEVHRLLLFTNHESELFAVPMAMVARIERVSSSDLSVVGSQNLLIYRGQSLPILRLEQNISARAPDEEQEKVFVVVFRVQDREIGLVAPALRDIRDIQMKIDAKTLREPGVLGTTVVDNTTTRILDPLELVRIKYSEWFEEEFTVSGDVADGPTTVLLAEDSDFFRNHVTRTLENEGFKVIGAVDGRDAWDHLQVVFDEIDVIITDIEMPRMNGLEFARAVRSTPNFSNLPIIALTSLAGDQDRQRGAEVGIDDYQIKMDPARLVDSVRKFASSTH